MLSPTSRFPMPIVTPRLILRPPTSCHADVHQYYDAVTESMNELKPWLPWARFHPTIETTKNYIKDCEYSWIIKTDNNIGLPLWIYKKDHETLVGNIVIWNIIWNIPKFEFGYWLSTSQTKNGYISEAVNALTRYSITKLGVKRVEIKCEAKNTRAKHVPERLGFNLEEILFNGAKAVSTGEPTDCLLYSCTNIKNLPELDVIWGNKK